MAGLHRLFFARVSLKATPTITHRLQKNISARAVWSMAASRAKAGAALHRRLPLLLVVYFLLSSLFRTGVLAELLPYSAVQNFPRTGLCSFHSPSNCPCRALAEGEGCPITPAHPSGRWRRPAVPVPQRPGSCRRWRAPLHEAARRRRT